ncbi:hypothetical protein GQ53DRAFT_331558 [Thozetella sp. PMI_491]|nr:hypothetical protein GQ53DRAFT_331558 [Thozetella sp. PMI_491]
MIALLIPYAFRFVFSSQVSTCSHRRQETTHHQPNMVISSRGLSTKHFFSSCQSGTCARTQDESGSRICWIGALLPVADVCRRARDTPAVPSPLLLPSPSTNAPRNSSVGVSPPSLVSLDICLVS